MASIYAFLQAYCNAPLERVMLDPRSLGMGPIGHMGYFKPRAEALWRETLEWFRAPLPAPSTP